MLKTETEVVVRAAWELVRGCELDYGIISEDLSACGGLG